jgi:hypothetical protein
MGALVWIVGGLVVLYLGYKFIINPYLDRKTEQWVQGYNRGDPEKRKFIESLVPKKSHYAYPSYYAESLG